MMKYALWTMLLAEIGLSFRDLPTESKDMQVTVYGNHSTHPAISFTTVSTRESPYNTTQTSVFQRTTKSTYPLPYVWKKETTTAEDYLREYGASMCAKSTSSVCPYPRPFPCGCDAGCETYGYCCHDRVTDLTVASSSTGCLQFGSYAIVTCPEHWRDEDVRDRCETGTGRYTQDDPVSDLSTNTTFRNEFCASCHGVTSFSRWRLIVTCKHFQYLYTALTEDAFTELATNHTYICNIGKSPPDGIKPVSCLQYWFSSRLIRRCNETGEWPEKDYDEDIARNCLLYKSLVLRVHYVTVYQNLFCAICNGLLPTIKSCGFPPNPTPGPGGFQKIVPPMSFLLGLQERVDQEVERNPAGCVDNRQWLDLQNECRNLTCPAGKLQQNGTCTTALSQIRGLAYSLNVSFTPTPPLRFTSSDYKTLLQFAVERMVLRKLRDKVHQCFLSVAVYVRRLPEFVSVDVEHVQLVGEVQAPRNVDRDEVESAIVDRLFFSEWVLILKDFNATTLMRDTQASYVVFNSENDTEAIEFLVKYSNPHTQLPRFPAYLLIPLTPMLTCPHLGFGPSDFEFHRKSANDTKLILLGDESVEVEAEQLQRTWVDSEGKLLVCLDVLKNIKRPTDDRRSDSSLWQYVLTMVLMPLSMLCLVLTLVVYGLLPALRTQPGLNTMGTCCALFVAQLSLLLAAHRVTSGPSCQALGIVVHMSWLSVFCWTFICSLHMFRVFSAKTYRRPSSHRCRKLAINVSLTLAVPGAVVAAVVVAKSMTTDESSIGYSDWRCYLESTLLVGVAMVLPVSLLLLLNLILFVLTVRRIHMVSRLNPHSEDQIDSQNHVYVCARLSTLTGLTWMVSLVAEGLDVDWLQFFSIVANGGQGILLFLSYVTTRRVAAMLSARLEDTKSNKTTTVHTVSTRVT